jgi:hypothetical protein
MIARTILQLKINTSENACTDCYALLLLLLLLFKMLDWLSIANKPETITTNTTHAADIK